MLQLSPSLWNIRGHHKKLYWIHCSIHYTFNKFVQHKWWIEHLKRSLSMMKDLRQKLWCRKSRWVHYKRKNNCPPKSTPTRLIGHDGGHHGGHQPPKCWGNLDFGVNNLASSCRGIPTITHPEVDGMLVWSGNVSSSKKGGCWNRCVIICNLYPWLCSLNENTCCHMCVFVWVRVY